MTSFDHRSEQQETGNERLPLIKRVTFNIAPLVVLLLIAEIALRVVGFRFAPLFIGYPIFEQQGDGVVQTVPMFTTDKPYGFPFCYRQ